MRWAGPQPDDGERRLGELSGAGLWASERAEPRNDRRVVSIRAARIDGSAEAAGELAVDDSNARSRQSPLHAPNAQRPLRSADVAVRSTDAIERLR